MAIFNNTGEYVTETAMFVYPHELGARRVLWPCAVNSATSGRTNEFAGNGACDKILRTIYLWYPLFCGLYR